MTDAKVNKTIKAISDVTHQYPVNVLGPKGQHAFVGSHKVFFSGATGLVATSYGIPGVTVGRLRTGVYGIRFPQWKEATVMVGLQVPTGVDYDAKVSGMSGIGHIVAVSGGAELHISRTFNAPVASGTYTPSSFVCPQNPVTGTVAELRFFVSPITPY
jgi:hypothetical protein